MSKLRMSSKGQIVIPEEIREDLGWERGTELDIQETPYGVEIYRIPEKPLKALKGILSKSGIKISKSEIKKMRLEDEQHDKYEKPYV